MPFFLFPNSSKLQWNAFINHPIVVVMHLQKLQDPCLAPHPLMPSSREKKTPRQCNMHESVTSSVRSSAVPRFRQQAFYLADQLFDLVRFRDDGVHACFQHALGLGFADVG